jgi:hypothetical protein
MTAPADHVERHPVVGLNVESHLKKLAVDYRPIESLAPYERNPRTHSPRQIDQLAASIKEFGFTNPILAGC